MTEKERALNVLRSALPDLQRRFPIRSLALFGSVARGDARADSDLDMLVDFARPVTLSSFLALESELGALTGRRVDLVSRRALKPHMGERILREAVAL